MWIVNWRELDNDMAVPMTERIHDTDTWLFAAYARERAARGALTPEWVAEWAMARWNGDAEIAAHYVHAALGIPHNPDILVDITLALIDHHGHYAAALTDPEFRAIIDRDRARAMYA